MESRERLLKKPFWFYILRDKRNVGLGLVCLLGTNILDALPPRLIGIAIDQIAEGLQLQAVGKTLLLLLLVTVGLSFFRYLWRIYWGRFHHQVAEHLRNQIFDRLSFLGPSFFQKKTVGELMSLINNDVNSFRMAVGPGVLILFDAIFLLFIIPPIMIGISWDWTWKTLILMPLIPFIVYRLLKVIHSRFKIQQNQFGELSGVTQEVISGVRVIKSFAQEKNQTRLFNLSSRNYELACNDVAKPDALFSPALETAVTVGSVILLFIGAPEVIAGRISIGEFFAFYQYIQRMVWPMTAIGLSLNFIQRGRASFGRIREVLQTEPDVKDEGLLEVEKFESLEFKNLSFAHPGQNDLSLKDISFRLNKGEVLALIGTTGSGKSSIVDLICRFYPFEKERVFINGLPIEKIRLKSLRNLLAVVPQVPFLFSRKVSENVAYGIDNPNSEEIQRITALVNIEKEIEALPEAYDSFIGEKGVNLSGGQKQRLTLARALLRQSPVLILDDSLSAVDTSTEQSILNMIRSAQSDQSRSAIVISNRISSVRWADRIVVLNQGRVEASGTHEELLQTSPTYQELSRLQTQGGRPDEPNLLH